MASVDKLITTKTPIEKFKFTWKIARFAEIRSSKKALEMQKCQFKVGQTVDIPSNWICFLECEEWEQDARNWISLGVKAEECSDSNVDLFKGRIHMDISHNEQAFQTENPLYIRKRDIFTHLIPQEEIFPWLSEDILDFEGNLCLQINFQIFNSTKAIIPDIQVPLSTLEHQFQTLFLENFQRDMANIYSNPICPASGTSMIVKIISCDGKELLVHRRILAARCPNLLKGNETVVKIDDISGTALKQLFSFLHTGALPKSWKDALIIEGLIIAAHKYKLENLQQFLDQVVGQVCTQANCGKLLKLAVKFHMKKAEEDLMKFFKNNWEYLSWQEILWFTNEVDSDVNGNAS